MPFIPAPGMAKVTVFGSGGPQGWQSVFYVGRGGLDQTPYDVLDLNAVALTFADLYAGVTGTPFGDLIHNSYAANEVRVKDASIQAGLEVSLAIVAPGNRGSDALPPQCSLVVHKRTPFAGRSYQGRVYQMGLVEADSSGGVYAAPAAENIRLFYDQMRIDCELGPPLDSELQIFSRVLAPPNHKHQVTSLTVNNRIDTQRRRAGRT